MEEDQCLSHIYLLKSIISTYNADKNDDNFLDHLEILIKKEESFYPLKKVIDNEEIEKQKNKFPLNLIYEFENCPEIKNKKILFEKNFLYLFHREFEKLLYMIAYKIANIGDFIETFVEFWNVITKKNYIKIDCSKVSKSKMSKFFETKSKNISDFSYNCGRALLQIDSNESPFLIFNTNDDAVPDITILNKYIIREDISEYLDIKLEIDNGEILNLEDEKEFISELKKSFENYDFTVPPELLIKKISIISKKIKKKLIIKLPMLSHEYLLKIIIDSDNEIIIPYEQRTQYFDDVIWIKNEERKKIKMIDLVKLLS